jgi:hypothetical protein
MEHDIIQFLVNLRGFAAVWRRKMEEKLRFIYFAAAADYIITPFSI